MLTQESGFGQLPNLPFAIGSTHRHVQRQLPTESCFSFSVRVSSPSADGPNTVTKPVLQPSTYTQSGIISCFTSVYLLGKFVFSSHYNFCFQWYLMELAFQHFFRASTQVCTCLCLANKSMYLAPVVKLVNSGFVLLSKPCCQQTGKCSENRHKLYTRTIKGHLKNNLHINCFKSNIKE
jgi:hypothetical protein